MNKVYVEVAYYNGEIELINLHDVRVIELVKEDLNIESYKIV